MPDFYTGMNSNWYGVPVDPRGESHPAPRMPSQPAPGQRHIEKSAADAIAKGEVTGQPFSHLGISSRRHEYVQQQIENARNRYVQARIGWGRDEHILSALSTANDNPAIFHVGQIAGKDECSVREDVAKRAAEAWDGMAAAHIAQWNALPHLGREAAETAEKAWNELVILHARPYPDRAGTPNLQGHASPAAGQPTAKAMARALRGQLAARVTEAEQETNPFDQGFGGAAGIVSRPAGVGSRLEHASGSTSGDAVLPGEVGKRQAATALPSERERERPHETQEPGVSPAGPSRHPHRAHDGGSAPKEYRFVGPKHPRFTPAAAGKKPVIQDLSRGDTALLFEQIPQSRRKAVTKLINEGIASVERNPGRGKTSKRTMNYIRKLTADLNANQHAAQAPQEVVSELYKRAVSNITFPKRK